MDVRPIQNVPPNQTCPFPAITEVVHPTSMIGGICIGEYMEEIYYVYMHYRPNDTIPFNVGKGTGRRAYIKDSRNRWWHNIVNKHGGFDVKFAATDMSEEDSFWLEEHLIKTIGRRDLGTGPLVNMTNGGEGASGYKHTEEYKQTANTHCIGKPSWNKGVPQREESRIKNREAHVGTICIYEIATEIRKMIRKNEIIPEGWKRGMGPTISANRKKRNSAPDYVNPMAGKLSWNSGKKFMWIRNMNSMNETLIEITVAIPDGWERGRICCS